jgi:hypothetical protein
MAVSKGVILVAILYLIYVLLGVAWAVVWS